MNTLTKAVAIVVLTISGTGLLPKIVLAVRKAQVRLIEETKASKWGRVPLLPATSSENVTPFISPHKR